MNKKIIKDGVAPTPKITKESLLKENAVLMHTIEREKGEYFEMRRIFSELLNSYETVQGEYSNRTEKKLKVLSWLGIAFMIGELKSDADYSLVIDAKNRYQERAENFENELRYTQRELAAIKMKYEKNVQKGDDLPSMRNN